jgi:hypothetical protein
VLAALLALANCTGNGSVDRNEPVEAAGFTPPPVEKERDFRDWLDAGCAVTLEHLARIRRGHFPGRSPDVFAVPRSRHFFGGFIDTSHSGPWDYLQRVPLVFYGPGFIRQDGVVDLDREVTLADVAPTLAELTGTKMPATLHGRVINEVLVPESERRKMPRLIVVVVWDGGGTYVLDSYPDTWPNLKRLAARGTAISNATVGSSPSITPAIHANIGTGEFPKQHGIVGIPLRVGGRVVNSFKNRSPENLIAPTLADLYDPTTANEAKIGMIAYRAWHLGMMGHGALWPGGDKDIAALVDTSENLVTNRAYYKLPRYLKRVPGLSRFVSQADASDGQRDGAWMGHLLDDVALRRDSPAWILYQTRMIKELLRREAFGTDDVPDLFFTNYKHPDETGHNFNMLSEEMPVTLRFTDAALGDLQGWLDDRVGRGKWVVVVTADHGQTPKPSATGAWPISTGRLKQDVEDAFEAPGLVEETSPAGLWLDRDRLSAAGATVEEVANWMLDYTIGDNASDRSKVPRNYRDRLEETLLAAAFPSDGMGRVWACAKAGDE